MAARMVAEGSEKVPEVTAPEAVQEINESASTDKCSHNQGLVDDETARAWEREQAELREKLVECDTEDWQAADAQFSGLKYIGGVDISFVKTSTSLACASLVICSFPDLEVVYEDSQTVNMTQPYISGFLAFREVPFFLDRLQRLRESKPDLIPQVIFVDGNGILHPRGFGTACHLGVLSDIPTIGIAKKLTQVDGMQKDVQHADKVASLESGGDSFDLLGASGKIWGKALRSCSKSSNPIFVSVGHRISLDTAVSLVQACCLHRVPEPVRQADIRSREFLRQTFPEHYPASASGKKGATTSLKSTSGASATGRNSSDQVPSRRTEGSEWAQSADADGVESTESEATRLGSAEQTVLPNEDKQGEERHAEEGHNSDERQLEDSRNAVRLPDGSESPTRAYGCACS
ncbi:endonuclease V-like [Diadema setosum]|uniref:endonuclease V-like n=1 Tax=Diadema setosum TaxID=31175 RepID=UPI003B3A0AC2